MSQSHSLSLAKYVLGELVGDILYAPLWWYSKGLLGKMKRMGEALTSFERMIGLRLWIKNLGKPMYGQFDWVSKIISFLMRLVLLFWKAIQFIFYVLWRILLIILWVLVPIFVVWQILLQLSGLLIPNS